MFRNLVFHEAALARAVQSLRWRGRARREASSFRREVGLSSSAAGTRWRARLGEGGRRVRSLLLRRDWPRQLLNAVGRRGAHRLGVRVSPFLPTHLDVEPTNYCNFKCDHCQVTHWDKPPGRLTAENLYRLLDQLPRLRHLKLQGMGEPLLNKQLCSLLHGAEGRGLELELTTNGSVGSRAVVEQLAGLRRTQITFSIDGATPETFARIRVGGDLARVRATISEVLRRRAGGRSPRVVVWTVASNQNLGELSDIVRLCSDLGVDQLTLSPFVSDWGKAESVVGQHVEEIQIGPGQASLRCALADAQRVAQALGLPLHINESSFLSRRNKCKWPWTSAYVAVNGDVVPCCIVADASVAKMGNVYEEEFSSIWNNALYRELRARIARHDPPAYCRNCYSDLPPAPSDKRRLQVV